MWYKIKRVLIWQNWQEKQIYPARLPSAYQEVEYIQTTGTQFINTWVFAYNNYQTETKIEVTWTTQDTPVFWSIDSTGWGNWLWWYYHLTPYNSKWYAWINNSESSWWTYNPTSWTQYTIVYNNTNNYLNVNGTDLFSVSWTVWYSWTNIWISSRWQWWNRRYWRFKYFYFKIYDKTAGQYIKNLVPCYRKSDNVIGMYDTIDNQFYTNSWTGTFTKWPNV